MCPPGAGEWGEERLDGGLVPRSRAVCTATLALASGMVRDMSQTQRMCPRPAQPPTAQGTPARGKTSVRHLVTNGWTEDARGSLGKQHSHPRAPEAEARCPSGAGTHEHHRPSPGIPHLG